MKHLRNKIVEKFEDMYSKCTGLGANPYSVNVITYTGHGFIYGGDEFAAIPEFDDEKEEGRYYYK